MADQPTRRVEPDRPTVVITLEHGVVVDVTSDVRALSYVVLDRDGVDMHDDDIVRIYDSSLDTTLYGHVEYGDTNFDPDFCDDANDPVFLDEDEIALLREHGPRGLTRATAVQSSGDAELQAQLEADGAEFGDDYMDDYEDGDDALDRAEAEAARPFPARVIRDAPGA